MIFNFFCIMYEAQKKCQAELICVKVSFTAKVALPQGVYAHPTLGKNSCVIVARFRRQLHMSFASLKGAPPSGDKYA